MVEESGHIHRYLLAFLYFPNSLKRVELDDGVGRAGVADWLPSLAFSRPKVPPADPVHMSFEPFDHDDVLSCVLLLVYFLVCLDSPGSINHWNTPFLAEANRVFSASSLLSLGGGCEHEVEEGLFGEVVVEEDALQKTAGSERPHSCLQRENNGLVVDEVHLVSADAQSKHELPAQTQNSEEGFNVFFHLFDQLLIVALLIPLLSQWVVLELLADVLRTVFFEAELHGT